MKGSLRSWVHYIDLRTEKNTQKEHRLIADECKSIFIKNFPTINYNLKELSNILIRFNFLNLNVLNDFCEYYYVNDEDSPESLSVTYYNDSFYSWVILFINDKFNRELDWPLASNKMDDYLSAKYDYSSVFVFENGIDYSFSKVKKIKYAYS
jgi:hypothetical protein